MAHIEVKSNLSGQLRNSLDKSKSVKKLNKKLDPAFAMGEVPTKVPSMVFAFEGANKDTFKENLKNYYGGQSGLENADTVDLVCVLDEYVAYNNSENGMTFINSSKGSLMLFFVYLSNIVFKNWQGWPRIHEYVDIQRFETF